MAADRRRGRGSGRFSCAAGSGGLDRATDGAVGGGRARLLDVRVDRAGGFGEVLFGITERFERRGDRGLVAAARVSLLFAQSRGELPTRQRRRGGRRRRARGRARLGLQSSFGPVAG